MFIQKKTVTLSAVIDIFKSCKLKANKIQPLLDQEIKKAN